jgi:DDE superfamily endonuclease
MLLKNVVPEVRDYINALNEEIQKDFPNRALSYCQQIWLGFVLSCMLLFNCLNWHKFEKITLGKISFTSYSKMFHQAKILWNKLIYFSARLVFKRYSIKNGVLVIDDTDRPRSKNTTHIGCVHTIKDKKTGGFIKGQNIVLLLLVTDKITIPVGFSFYEPDPAVTTWRKEDKKLRKQKVAKKDRPTEIKRNPTYPTKSEIALQLLNEFCLNFPDVAVKAVIADAIYGHSKFLDNALSIYDTQVISQLRSNQLIKPNGSSEYKSLVKYFSGMESITNTISIRGGENKTITYASAQLYIKSHKKKRIIVALKYEGETEYRYLIATNPNWLVTTIVQTYTLRWLVEVFFFDWKENEGWAKMAKQQRVEGSRRGLILSVLLDHCLLLHPSQIARIEGKLPACTVGSLRAKLGMDTIVRFVEDVVASNDPLAELTSLKIKTEELITLIPSKKHMNNNELDVFNKDDLSVAA